MVSATQPSLVALEESDESDMDYVAVARSALPTIDGVPIVQPPYGRITALDPTRGEIAWQVPNGGTPPAIRDHPLLKGVTLPPTGSRSRAGLLATKTLLFAGEGWGGQPVFRALDKATGKTSWETALPAVQTGPPRRLRPRGRGAASTATTLSPQRRCAGAVSDDRMPRQRSCGLGFGAAAGRILPPRAREAPMHTHSRPSRRTFLLTGGALAAAAAVRPWPLGAQSPGFVKIGIIGSGRQGGAIGLLWAKAGHEVLFSSRHPESLTELVAQAGAKARAGLPEEAARFGEVILMAVPYGALPQVGKDYAPLMQGKIVIDVGNPRVDRDGEVGKDGLARGTGVTSKEHLPGVRLVRALNALSFTQVTKEAHRAGEKLGIPIAADDAAAIAMTVRLVTDAGFDPVVVGGLARAREFDAGTSVYVKGLTAAQLKAALELP